MGRCLSSRFHFWDELCSLPVGRSSFQARKLCIHECSLSVGRSGSQVRTLCIHEGMVECNHAHLCAHMLIDFLFSTSDVYIGLNCTRRGKVVPKSCVCRRPPPDAAARNAGGRSPPSLRSSAGRTAAGMPWGHPGRQGARSFCWFRAYSLGISSIFLATCISRRSRLQP